MEGCDCKQHQNKHQQKQKQKQKQKIDDHPPLKSTNLFVEILIRLVEPIQYKFRLYQIAVLLMIDYALSLVVDKYTYVRVKIAEKKISLKRDKLQQTQARIDWITSDILMRLGDAFSRLQTMHPDCVTCDKTPALFCEPHIRTGFRPLNKPYSYYVLSLFTKHNETVNVWSHLIGGIYMIYLALSYDFTDPYSWPILTSILTSATMFFASALAHLMHQKSHSCHMNCFLCDFGGISFNAFGASLMQIHICAPLWYFKAIEPYLLPLLGTQSAACCILNSIAQTKYTRPYPKIKKFLQFAPCGFLWLFSMFPVFVGAFVVDESIKIDRLAHFGHTILFVTGAIFFALEFPQRFFPGKLDFIGQGHNIFHVCILAVVTLQFHGCYADYEANRHVLQASRTAPTFSYCFVSLAVLSAYYIYVIRFFKRAIDHNFDEDGNLINEKEQQVRVQDIASTKKPALVSSS